MIKNLVPNSQSTFIFCRGEGTIYGDEAHMRKTNIFQFHVLTVPVFAE